jgi:hypothetical protein
MHVLGPCRAQRPGALVGGRTRGVDVVDERDGPRPRTRRERAAHVAPALAGIEPPLRADGARAPHERQDRDAPPAGELLRELGRRVGAAQQQPVGHGGNHGDRLDRGPRDLVRHPGGGQPGRRDLAALPAADERQRRALQPDCRAGAGQPAQPGTGAAGGQGERRGRPAAGAERRRERPQTGPAGIAHPLPGGAAGDAASGQHEPDEGTWRQHRTHATGAPRDVSAASCAGSDPEVRGPRRAGSARRARGALPPPSRSP